MKIIDARSGEVMTRGKVVSYGSGEQLRLIDLDEGLFSARALIETIHCDYTRTIQRPGDQGVHRERGPLVTTRQWIPLAVRFMHPSYRFQRVAFIPS